MEHDHSVQLDYETWIINFSDMLCGCPENERKNNMLKEFQFATL